MESGRFRSIEQARRHYDIGGSTTVRRWLEQFGKNHLIPKVVRVEKPNEACRIRQFQLPRGAEPIHHSDRGSQYCCHDYVKALGSAGVKISMTQENHCYENAKAERLNGILKQEYGLGGCLASKRDALGAVDEAVKLYNCRRPHQALDYATSMSVHEAA